MAANTQRLQAHDLGEWQDHLDVLLGGHPAKLSHGSLMFDLVLFLQATLSFSLGGKTLTSALLPEVQSRDSLRSTRQSRYGQLCHSWSENGVVESVVRAVSESETRTEIGVRRAARTIARARNPTGAPGARNVFWHN